METMLHIIQIPLLTDNYAYLLRDNTSGETAVIDPSEAEPILALLNDRGWQLDWIVNTHHHWDHTGGNIELKRQTKAKIIAYAGDSHRIKYVDKEVQDGETVEICGAQAQVIFIPGHTLGHIAYYFPESGTLFCGDTLFSMGCGKLFEGTPQQMFSSLQKLRQLPYDTKVYCGHEYTEKNGSFALTIEPDNKDMKKRMEEVRALRAKGLSTVPSTIGMEKKTNPFLRAESVEEFARIRALKDNF